LEIPLCTKAVLIAKANLKITSFIIAHKLNEIRQIICETICFYFVFIYPKGKETTQKTLMQHANTYSN